MKKRTLSVVLTALLVLGLFPSAALAQERQESPETSPGTARFTELKDGVEPQGIVLNTFSILASDVGETTLNTAQGPITLKGKGTVESPLQISTGEELYAFAECFNEDKLPLGYPSGSALYLMLTDNIDISAYTNWTPIGSWRDDTTNKPFEGTFTSNGDFTISGLQIQATDFDLSTNCAFGLFGYVNGGVFERIKVSASNVGIIEVGAQQIDTYAGVLVGRQDGGSINSCSASGRVETRGSLATRKVTAAGGLAGSIGAVTLSNSSADGSINASGGDYTFAGGLVGRAETSSKISGSHATGHALAMSGGQYTAAGGLVGYTDSDDGSTEPTSVDQSYATGLVTASGGQDYNLAGGLVGFVDTDTVITHSYASGLTTAMLGQYANAGGLVGRSTKGNSFISSCYATGGAEAKDGVLGNMVGGLIGLSSNPVSNSYATGSATAVGTTGDGPDGSGCYAGGLTGYSDSNSDITNCYAAGSVLATGGEKLVFAGGVSGRSGTCTISNSVALAEQVLAVGKTTDVFAGRIEGKNPKSATLGNNYAWEGMLVGMTNRAPAPISTSDAYYGSDNLHGAHVTDAQALSSVWWALGAQAGGPAFNATTVVWDTYDGYLPLLKDPKGTLYRPAWLKYVAPVTSDTGGTTIPSTGDTFVWLLAFVVLCALGSAGAFAYNRHRRTRSQ